MRISLAERGRRVARWGAGLLLALWAVLVIVLCLTTSGPVPRAFAPEKALLTFLALSLSGRCCITHTLLTPGPHQGALFGDDVQTNVLDTATMQLLGSFQGEIESRWHFEIGPDRQFLFTREHDRLLLRHFEAGKEEIFPIEAPWQKREASGLGVNTVFASSGRQLLIHSANRAFLYDCGEHRTLATYELFDGRGRIFACFFDSNNRPKVLVFSGSWEVWDLAANRRRGVRLDSALPEYTDQLGTPVISPAGAAKAPTLVRLFQDMQTLFTRSLEDGHVLQTFATPAPGAKPLKFSPDGRFLICSYHRQYPLMAFAAGRFAWLDKWIEDHSPYPELRLALLDLQTGRTWLDIRGGERCAFTDDSARLITFAREGRYEYDVPPRWQYFTPWVWAALGAWLSLIAVWWRLRKRKPGEVCMRG